MTLFDDILAGYTLGNLAILNAGRSDGHAASKEAEQAARVNDSAYFFMLFARFEDRIVKLSKSLVDERRRSRVAADRRPWDIIPDKLALLNCVALLTDKGGSDYRDVQELYQDRNRIGHGELLETNPNVPAIAAKLSGILSRLEGTP